MSQRIRALLFDYGGTLVSNWPSAAMSRPEPGLHTALRQLAPHFRLAIAAANDAPSAAIRDDLARLGLADLFAVVHSAADSETLSPAAAIQRTLADLGVSADEALLVTGRESPPGLPGLRHVHYHPAPSLGARLWTEVTHPNATPILTTLDDLPATVSALDRGERPARTWPSAVRLGTLLLGLALGTAAAAFLRQRQLAELEEADDSEQ